MAYPPEEGKKGFFQKIMFGEGNQPDAFLYQQLAPFVDARIEEGLLRIEIDLYDHRLELAGSPATPDTWDVDVWEREKYHLEAAPNRAGWIEAYRVARGMLSGKTIVWPNGESVSRESFLGALA